MEQHNDILSLWPYLLIIVVLFVAVLVLAVCLRSMIRQNQKLQKQADDYEKMRQKCETYKTLARDMRPATDIVNGMRRDLVEAVKAESPLSYVADKLLIRIKNSDTTKSLDFISNKAADAELAIRDKIVIKQLQKKIGDLIDGDLQQQEPPGDTAIQRTNRGKFIAMAMMAFDVVESIDNPNASENWQGLNVKLMTGELLPEEVREQAEKTHETLRNQSETWARTLQSALRTGVDLNEDQLLLMRGHLFKGYQMDDN